MKRIIPLLICLLILCGCASQEAVKEVNIRGKQFTVDTQAQTLHDGSYTYTYQMSGNHVQIFYPDGTWYDVSTGGGWVISWSDDFDSSPSSKYANGQDLADAVVQATETEPFFTYNRIMGIVLVVLGVVYVLWPGIGWKLRYSIWVKDAEPTDFALGVGRAVGAVCIVVGIVVFFL